jgi:hypothetical protein
VTGRWTLWRNRRALCADQSQTRAAIRVEAEGGGFNPTLLFEGGGAGTTVLRWFWGRHT